MDDTAKLIAIVVLASFAIERIVAAISYLIDSVRLYQLNHPAAAKLREKHQRKAFLLTAAALLAIGVVYLADLRILRTLKLGEVPPEFDFALTWLVLFAGADRVRDFLQGAGGSGAAAETSEVPGFRIVVDDGAEIREIHRAS
ncbi:MAG TPA: hypothetical protein VNA69_14705 [Thermoanaerobaculia bacterium]|nr:hypothetical protein [Thermoanaerobaculia bacterium]